jgi:single-stranded DNA-binding protein
MKNTVQLIGHVGQDPEVKNLEGGKKLANLSIATNEVYYKENGQSRKNGVASCNCFGENSRNH